MRRLAWDALGVVDSAEQLSTVPSTPTMTSAQCALIKVLDQPQYMPIA
jgi:hypothetical protein